MNHLVTPVRGLRRFGLLAVCLGTGLLVGPTAWAQVGGGPVGTTGKAGRQQQPDKPVVEAPDAVPGARARGPVAPATKVAADMRPNEALFDAINRGDIAAARDSLNRGADLDAVNILGMTPMELSVDLGRNDISFLLLSMRGEDSGRGSSASGRSNAGSPPPPIKTAGATNPPAPARTAAVPAPAKPVATPKLFANDGGTPLPSAGFLGFGRSAAT